MDTGLIFTLGLYTIHFFTLSHGRQTGHNQLFEFCNFLTFYRRTFLKIFMFFVVFCILYFLLDFIILQHIFSLQIILSSEEERWNVLEFDRIFFELATGKFWDYNSIRHFLLEILKYLHWICTNIVSEPVHKFQKQDTNTFVYRNR